MSRIAEYLGDAKESLSHAFRSTKDAYDQAGRFARMRLWIMGAFGLDVVLVVALATVIGARAIDVDVWFQPGFPSDMLVVRNEGGDVLRDVQFVLDDRYRLRVDALPLGLQGFEVSRDFRDASGTPPGRGYEPRVVEVRTGGASMRLDVEQKSR